MFNFSCVVNTDIELTEINLYILNSSDYTEKKTVYTSDLDLIDSLYWNQIDATMISNEGILHKNDPIKCYFDLKNADSSAPQIYSNQVHIFLIVLKYTYASHTYHSICKYNVAQTELGTFSINQIGVI